MTPEKESAIQAVRDILSRFEPLEPEFLLKLSPSYGALVGTGKEQPRAPESWEIDEAQMQRMLKNGAVAWAGHSQETSAPEAKAIAQLMQDPDTGKRYVQYLLPLSLLEVGSVFYVGAPVGNRVAFPQEATPSPSPAELRVHALDQLIDRGLETYLDESVAPSASAVGVEGAPERKEVPCSTHPEAPHGFNRNASHSAGRYVCDCEGWDAWAAGYDEGMQAAFAAESASEDRVTEQDHLEACCAVLARHCAKVGSDEMLFAAEHENKAFAITVASAEILNARMQALKDILKNTPATPGTGAPKEALFNVNNDCRKGDGTCEAPKVCVSPNGCMGA